MRDWGWVVRVDEESEAAIRRLPVDRDMRGRGRVRGRSKGSMRGDQ